MVNATRSGFVGGRRNQETRRRNQEDCAENQSRLIDESSETEEIELSIVPYEPVGEEGEAHNSPSEAEIDPTEITVEKQMEREDRRQRVCQELGLPPPKRAKKTGETSTKSVPTKSFVRSKRFISSTAQKRYDDFVSRKFIEERLIDLEAQDEWGYLELLKNSSLAPTVSHLGSYVKEVVCEFYANLPEKVSPEGIKVSIRKHEYVFSPQAINDLFGLSSLTKAELKADADVDTVSEEKLAVLLSEKDKAPAFMKLSTLELSPKIGALVRLAAYNWFPSSHQNHISKERARIIYKLFHGVRCDFGKLAYDQITSALKKDDKRMVIFPRLIFGVLMRQKEPQLFSRERVITPRFYKKDKRTGITYKKMEEISRKTDQPVETTSEHESQPPEVSRQPAETASAPVSQPASGDQTVDIFQVGDIRVPRIGQTTSENSYEALVDTARALQVLTHVVQRLINNQNRR